MLGTLGALYSDIPPGPGHRLATLGELAPFLSASGPVGSLVAQHLGLNVNPVRCIAFDKTGDANWSLGWHQDRSICVAERYEVDGFAPWTTKQGIQHVEPPFSVIESMVTARVHLDRVDAINAPLLIARGSHRLGLVAERRIGAVVEQCGEYACLAEPGDVWLYSTPILHASQRAEPGRRRRVLQVDFSAADLPKPLEWMLD